ncbi:hypothetical protein [Actinophytocola sp. NPDC049390]|uniref:hypothetical protein n=1 Tax=Actinophytocola sp. NPDC049390 TaxID=3363894 RepID=UPI0037942D55
MSGRRVAVAVPAEEVSSWVRRTIPTRLARVERTGARLDAAVDGGGPVVRGVRARRRLAAGSRTCTWW